MNTASYNRSTIASSPWRLLRVVLLAGVVAGSSPLAAAEHASPATASDASAVGAVDVQVNLGFSDTVRLGHHAPVTVTLVNRGAALVGRLEVVAADGDPMLGDRYTSTNTRRVELPGDSRKRFRFTVYFESFAQPLLVRVVAGGRVVAERSIDLRRRVTTARLLLVLSRDADLDTLNDPREGHLRVLYPHPDLLPDRWQGYDGVAAMVVHGVSLERLGAEQFAALRKWLTRGGILAVSGGPDYSLLGTPRLAELLPGVPVGQVRVADIAEQDAALGTLSFGSGAVDVNQVTGFTGSLLLGSAALPLAMARRIGRGTVLYLSFDVAREPFRRWTGMRQLWLDLLRLPPVQSLASQLAERPFVSPLPEFAAAAARPFPNRWPLILFLALYLGVLALGYRKPADNRRVRWVLPLLVWLTPVVFALCAHLVFGRLLFPKSAGVLVAGVIAPHGQGPAADLQLQLGWYANHRTDLRLEYQGVEAVFRPLGALGGRGRPAVDWMFADPPHGAVQPVSRRGYQLHAVEGEDVIAFDLRAQVTRTPRGPMVVVRNDSGRPIRDALLVFHDAVYAVGTIAADSTWSRTLDPAVGALRFGDEPWFDVLRRSADVDPAPGSAAARRLAHAILRARREPAPPPDRMLLVGQVPGALRLTGASASWPRSEITLLLDTVPIAFAGHAGRDR